MKKLIPIIILIIFSQGCVTTWDRKDKLLLKGLVVGQGYDTYQTHRIMDGEFPGLREGNPMMKSMDIVIAVKLVTVGVTIWLADLFPECRTVILGIGNAVTWPVVVWNYRKMH